MVICLKFSDDMLMIIGQENFKPEYNILFIYLGDSHAALHNKHDKFDHLHFFPAYRFTLHLVRNHMKTWEKVAFHTNSSLYMAPC